MTPHRITTSYFNGGSTITFLLLLQLLTPTSSSPSIPGLDTFLTNQFRLDAKASNDSFGSLPFSLKRSLSPSPSSLHFSSLSQSLLSLSISIPINVRFVGDSFPSSAASTFSDFISSAVTDDNFHVISPLPDSASNHKLAVSHSLHLDASLYSPSLEIPNRWHYLVSPI